MTLPNERLRALKYARAFLIDLLNPSLTPKVPKAIRERASSVLRHYPFLFEIEELAKSDPKRYSLENQEKIN